MITISHAPRTLCGAAAFLNHCKSVLPTSGVNRASIRNKSKRPHKWPAITHKKGSTEGKAITMETINPRTVEMQYAVRGPLVIRSDEIVTELLKGAAKPFKRVVKANIGDAHAMGQVPITFIRQVLACVVQPDLIKSNKCPADVVNRATSMLEACSGQSIGSYSTSNGIAIIRKNIASYIERRDGHKANWEDISLTAGASAGIKYVLALLCNTVNGKDTGVMIPIPQYPLYSAALVEYGLVQVHYYLNENRNWALELEELDRAYSKASKNCAVRAMVVINPGNPTGQVLTRENIEEIIKFAHKHTLFLFADEVYQDNIYAPDSKFHSFKKVVTEMGPPYSGVELASFMSISKGYMGECGLRGGWMELLNMDPQVQANLYKSMSANLCPSTVGQIAADCVANPPKQGDQSYDLWLKEKKYTLDSLADRSRMVVEKFNNIEGFKCNIVQGAMYAFPRIELPAKAIEAAKVANKPPDVFYAFKLLEETGICIIPGSGFGQYPGTYHFRTTILPQPDVLQDMLNIFEKFHQKFTKEFS